MELCERAMELDTNNYTAYFYLATAYENKGIYDLAIESYNQAIKIKPSDKESMYSLIILYIMQGEKNKALYWIPILAKLDAGWGKELKIVIERMR